MDRRRCREGGRPLLSTPEFIRGKFTKNHRDFRSPFVPSLVQFLGNSTELLRSRPRPSRSSNKILHAHQQEGLLHLGGKQGTRHVENKKLIVTWPKVKTKVNLKANKSEDDMT